MGDGIIPDHCHSHKQLRKSAVSVYPVHVSNFFNHLSRCRNGRAKHTSSRSSQPFLWNTHAATVRAAGPASQSGIGFLGLGGFLAGGAITSFIGRSSTTPLRSLLLEKSVDCVHLIKVSGVSSSQAILLSVPSPLHSASRSGSFCDEPSPRDASGALPLSNVS